MGAPRYYTLVASLPRLPYFERAEYLPLSRRQIDQRLSMLEPQDAEELRLAERLIQWQRQPIHRTTEQLEEGYRLLMQRARNPGLRELVEFRMGQRTALVALRRKRRGLPVPRPGEAWGVGSWLRRIQAAWDRPDLGLAALFPALGRARALLEAGDMLELDRLLMGLVWQRLSRIADPHPFGFEPVFAFVFKWDMVQRWLSYDAQASRSRFQELIEDVTREHQQLFA